MREIIKNLQKVHVKEFLDQEDDLVTFRQEYKFIVPLEYLNDILDSLKEDFFYSHFDHGFVYKYHNTYFDTKNYTFFNLHRQGKYNRIKIRIREYKNGVQNKYLECKRKIKGVKITKERAQIDLSINDIGNCDEKFLDSNLQKYQVKQENLVNITETFYNRVNLISTDRKKRITLDFDIHAKNNNSNDIKIIPGYFILELKSRDFPKKIIKLLHKEYKLREENFSKYCVSLCLLNQNLKKNRWKRILKKYC